MQLPYSDELNIGYLSRLFDNTTNCYKFFWFQAILKKVNEGHFRFTFDELIDEMIVEAWYMVTEYHLRLGPIGSTDNLEEVVKYINKEYHFRPSEKLQVILDFLRNSEDKGIRSYKSILIQNVPYHIQEPFYDGISISRSMWSGSKQILIDTINSQGKLIYSFSVYSGIATTIEISQSWIPYFIKHREILRSWAQLKLIQYLQKRNPSVPGLSDKLEPPISRDIERVRKYWKEIAKADPGLMDIYGGNLIKDIVISVDHFVPWQYVAHDELWNLHPTTRKINSSKSNSLPAWDKYFDLLGDIEYRAYELRRINQSIAKKFDEIAPYHINNQEIMNSLYQDEKLDRSEFKKRLENVIKPVYDSAKNQGFREWSYVNENNHLS